VLLICFGTRPEWLKVKPLVEKMQDHEFELLFTGQHQDLLKDVWVDYQIHPFPRSCDRLSNVVADCLTQFPKEEFDGVLVQGDTASAFGCALAAFHRGLKIYYLESGLRSHNLQHPFPEEGYRQMISRLANVNFAPTKLSAENLCKENVGGEVHVVGNSILDTLKGKTDYGTSVLVTLHRRENHDKMHEWFTAVDRLAHDNPHLDFILPIHPNPAVQSCKDLLENVTVIQPLPHDLLITLLRDSRLIITDSGGLQEEGTFFQKKVIVCRETTERPEGIDTGHLHICPTPAELSNLFYQLVDDYEINEPCPYGDGKTSEKVYKILRNL
jgi:UDP-N-acetylglucosamine 2-epimerase (non-hydrolysing)